VLLADEHDYICFELATDARANPQRLLAAFAVHARRRGSGGVRKPDLAGPIVSTASRTGDLAAAVLDRLFPHTPPDAVGSAGELWLP
jgi:hypothetical protein